MTRSIIGAVLLLGCVGCFRLLSMHPAREDLSDGGDADGDGDGDADGDGDGDADGDGDGDGDDSGPAPDCTGHGDCDDGVGCNGAELCVAGSCVPGTPPTVDDGTGCTVDACHEPRGWVTNLRDSTSCPPDTHCFGEEGSGCIACPDNPCVPVLPQCGCPEGQACYVGLEAVRTCRTPGERGLGEVCTTLSDCLPGLLCLSIHSGFPGPWQCYRPCLADRDCFDAPNDFCLIAIDTSAYRACTTSCDPATLEGCNPDESVTCLVEPYPPALDGFVRYCSGPAGPGTAGEPCANNSSCARGLRCTDPDGAAGPEPRQCLRWCHRDDPVSCGAGETCEASVPPVFLDTVEYGVCR